MTDNQHHKAQHNHTTMQKKNELFENESQTFLTKARLEMKEKNRLANNEMLEQQQNLQHLEKSRDMEKTARENEIRELKASKQSELEDFSNRMNQLIQSKKQNIDTVNRTIQKLLEEAKVLEEKIDRKREEKILQIG